MLRTAGSQRSYAAVTRHLQRMGASSWCNRDVGIDCEEHNGRHMYSLYNKMTRSEFVVIYNQALPGKDSKPEHCHSDSGSGAKVARARPLHFKRNTMPLPLRYGSSAPDISSVFCHQLSRFSHFQIILANRSMSCK